MYIRFVVTNLDEDSGRRQGVFQALVDAREDGKLYEYEIERLKEIHAWFNENLEKPAAFSRSSRPHAMNKAISWFKDGAAEHIARMRELVSILEGHGIAVDIIRTEKLGYVVYEDEYQVTAEPFYETRA